MTENILFICGSLNQTTMMHQIAKQLGEYDCFFTPYYADGIEDFVTRLGLLNFTVLGGRHMQETRAYLAANNLPVDDRGRSHKYDLVVTCSDLIIQNNVRGNGGTSVQKIAEITRRLLHTPLPVLERIRKGYRARPKWQKADLF